MPLDNILLEYYKQNKTIYYLYKLQFYLSYLIWNTKYNIHSSYHQNTTNTKPQNSECNSFEHNASPIYKSTSEKPNTLRRISLCLLCFTERFSFLLLWSNSPGKLALYSPSESRSSSFQVLSKLWLAFAGGCCHGAPTIDTCRRRELSSGARGAAAGHISRQECGPVGIAWRNYSLQGIVVFK